MAAGTKSRVKGNVMPWVRAAAAAVFAVTLALPPAAGAAPLYTLLDLGTLNPALTDNPTDAYDVNELGQVVGSSFNSEGRQEAFRTAPNARINPLTDGLGTLGGRLRASSARGINDQGQAVGSVNEPTPPNDTPRAYVTGPNQRIVSHMGTFTGGIISHAWGINNSGQVVGWSTFVLPGDAGVREHAFRTSASRPLTAADDLGTLSTSPLYDQSIAGGINDRGQAVGWSLDSQGRRTAFRTAPNAPINPATDNLGTLGRESEATAINLQGQVVGYAAVDSGGFITHAFRTRPNASINPLTDDIGTLGGARSYAYDINDFGVVVGEANALPDPPGDRAPSHAFVYIDGEGMLDLNRRIAGGLPRGWVLSHAEGINNRGQIVGVAIAPTASGSTTVRAFLLTPVPEPGVAGAAVGALILVWRVERATRRRKSIIK
jgi:probable HAF family extracellular repeat protein